MPVTDERGQVVRLSRRAVAGASVFGVLMLGLLGVQVAMIEDQRSTTDQQLANAVRQTKVALDAVEDLREARLTDLSRSVRRARPATTAEQVRALSSEVLDAGLPALTAEFLEQDRLRRLLVRSTAVLGEVQERDLVRRVAQAADRAPQLEALARRAVALTERLLATQVDALATAKRTEAAAVQAAQSAQSIDRKTGGTLPGATR
jgi:hypothetical protein